MIRTIKLGYLEFNTKNIQALEHYYLNVLGLSLTEGNESEKYISIGLEHHNIALKQANESTLNAIGYQISKNIDLKDALKFLKDKGIVAEIRTDARPGIRELIELHDVDGYRLHLYQEIELPAPGFNEHGIAPHKLGHIAIGSLKPDLARSFYMEILNFKYTDRIGNKATFLTYSTDHHTLNISSFGYAMLHHFAFELRDSSHHTRSGDILAKHKIPLVWGPSRHTAGHNIASYHHDPDYNLVELYTDMDYFIEELNYFEPRPWHTEIPLRPKEWDKNCLWDTEFEYSILDSVLKKHSVHKKIQ